MDNATNQPTDEAAELYALAAVVSTSLEPRRIRAERGMDDAARRLKSVQAEHARAVREVEAIKTAIADPRRFAALGGEFMAALKSGRNALDRFLIAKEDGDLRTLLFGLRLDAEFGVRRDGSVEVDEP